MRNQAAREPRGEDSSKDLLQHAKTIRAVAPRLGATAQVDMVTFSLHVGGRERCYDFLPQFLVYDNDNKRHYRSLPGEGNAHFIGWLPYFNKTWPLALDKVAFKEFCSAKGLRTPSYRTEPDASLRDFLVKKRRSSFGIGIRGPFSAFSDSDPDQRLLEGEYYEQFVRGTIAKIWYWEGKPACLEMAPMPTVSGDGRHSMHQLIIAALVDPRNAPPRPVLERLAHYQDVSLDDILPAGRSVIADFRYGTGLHHRGRANSNVLPHYAGTDLARQLADAGPILWNGIPDDIRPGTLWTLDAIIDEAGSAWYLEMNCNPMVHPDAYFPMLAALLGRTESAPFACEPS